MNQCLVLYHAQAALTGPGVSEMFASSTPEQMEAGMGAWRAWYEKCGSAVVDLGARLDHATTLTRDFSDPGRTNIAGYTILQADSLEQAISLMKGHPHFHMPDPSVQILECVRMPGL